jgi:hypothetical protein
MQGIGGDAQMLRMRQGDVRCGQALWLSSKRQKYQVDMQTRDTLLQEY